jgi:hypothetical protein
LLLLFFGLLVTASGFPWSSLANSASVLLCVYLNDAQFWQPVFLGGVIQIVAGKDPVLFLSHRIKRLDNS